VPHVVERTQQHHNPLTFTLVCALMIMQVCKSFCKFLEVFATFYFIAAYYILFYICRRQVWQHCWTVATYNQDKHIIDKFMQYENEIKHMLQRLSVILTCVS